MRTRRWLPRLAAGASLALVLWRLVPDVDAKPLFEDEAIAGLVSARPLRELLGTVVLDRGGAPLHFVLVHVALWLDSSAASLRWLSVLAALGAVLATYDLGRRLGGAVAGAAATILAATSSLLSVYGSFGRMYALLALAGALSADLFLRALELRTGRAALLAAVGAWFLAASHPYGGVVAASEAAVALVLWRGRPLRPAVPTLAVAAASLPFAWADLRLARRFDVGGGDRRLASPGHVWRSFLDALSGFSGGTGLVVVLPVLAALALLGFGLGLRRFPAFAALAASALLTVPILLSVLPVGRATGARQVSPRHLIFALPVWAALIGLALSWLLARRSTAVVAVSLAALAAVAVAFPSTAVDDPRDDGSLVALGAGHGSSALGSRESLAAPARWLRARVRERDLLFPYSALFLAALPESARGVSLPRSHPSTLLRTLRRAPRPYGCLYVAVPVGRDAVRVGELRAALPRAEVAAFRRWLVVRSCDRLRGPAAALRALSRSLGSTERAVASSARLRLFLRFSRRRVVDPARSRSD